MNRTRSLVFASLFTALIIVGSYIRIPVGPVPIVLATMFVLLAGVVLELKWAIASVGLYLALGAIGLPVFSSGAGIAYFLGPTGGYLLGYLLAAITANLLSSSKASATSGTVWRDAAAVAAASIVIYVPGLLWLKASLEMSWQESLALGLLPFILGDTIKAVLVVSAATVLKRRFPELVPRIT